MFIYTTFSAVNTIITVDNDHFTVYTLTGEYDQTDQCANYHHTKMVLKKVLWKCL